MKKYIRYIVALFLLAVSQTLIAQESTQRPISEILNPDGTHNLNSGISGSFDPAGYQMTTDANAQPMFAPGDANWSGDVVYGTIPVNQTNSLGASGGNIYLGGTFTSIGGVSANRIAKWNGTTWSALGTGISGGGNAVTTIGTSVSDVYVSGLFTTAGGTAVNGIAKWNGSTWSALGSGIDGAAYAITTSGSDVYVGGSFTTAGGVSVANIAKWNGTAWSALGTGLNGIVRAIAVSGTDVYVGGEFTTAGGASANYIAKWNGSTWSSLGNGVAWPGFPPAVHAIQISGSDVYVGGNFMSAGGVAASFVAKWNGSTWSSLGSGVDNTVLSILLSGNDLYVGGQFTTAGGVSASNIAKWNGSAWSALGQGLNSVVAKMAISGSNLFVSGAFTTAGGIAATNFASFNKDVPLAQPSNLVFSNVTSSAMTLTWTKSFGGSSGYLLLRKTGSSPTGVPVKGTVYSAGQTLGDGIVTYVGTDSTFSVTGLSINTEYYYDIFAYNGSGASTTYLTTSPLEGSRAIPASEPSSQPTNLSFSNVGGTSMTLSWTAATGSPAGYLILRKTVSSPTGTPSDGVAYTAGQTIGDGTVAYSGSAATANLTGLTSATTYFFDVFSYNGSGAATNYLTTTPLEGSQATVTSVAISSVTTNPTSATAGTDLTVTANVTGTSPTVVLYYGNWNQSVGDSLTDASSPFQFTIPASKVNSAGLWIRVKASNAGGTVFNPSSNGRTNIPVTSSAASVTTLLSNGTFPSGVPLSNYVSISLPLNKPLNLTSLLGSQEPKGGVPTKWRLMAWDPVQSVFIDKTTMENGKGYFLIMREASTFLSNISGGTTNDRSLFDSQILTPGWNIIGWPLGFTGNLTVTNSSSIDPVWQLKGGTWSQDAQVKPFGAIAVKNKTAGNLTVSNVLSYTQTAKSTAESGWSLRMKAYAGERMDEDNFIGVRSASSDGYDETDASNPLNIGEYVNAYFKTNDPQAGNLAFDMRNAQNEGNVWDMHVEHNTQESNITLRWEDLGLPGGFDAIMVDVHHNKTINLKEQNEYTFKPRLQNPFKILVGNPQFIQSKALELEKSLPKEFALSQNYPNPFNPETTIRYAIARTGRISLRVYNILGQEVRTLVSGVKETGIHEVTWDGKNNLGQSVASGIYIYRLEAGSFSRTKKLMFVK